MTTQLIEALINALKAELSSRPQKVEVEAIGAWCRADMAYRYFGIPVHRLRELVATGKVIAKKIEPEKASSAVIFRTADIEKAIEEMPNHVYTVA